MTTVHNSWYVQIEGQVYGPYTHALMNDYVQEGRIIDESQITANPDKGFVSASRYPQFQEWKPEAEPKKSEASVPMAVQEPVTTNILSRPAPQPVMHRGTPQGTQPALVTTQQVQPAQQATQNKVHQAVFVIMAEIRSGQTMGFLQALQSFGVAQRVGDTVWLLRSAHSSQSLRNALSQTLTQQDRLFIVDSFANETAWFNIGQDMDTRIRALWAPETYAS